MLSASFFLANIAVWMMFVSLPMLLIGNAFIGLFEGLILAVVFKVRWKRAVVLMIAANYVSMLAGLGLFGFVGGDGLFHWIWRPTIVDYREWFWTALGLAFVLSLLIEWPICRLAFSKPRRSWRRSMLACGMLQVASYLLCLVPILNWYEEIHINDTVEIVPVTSIMDGDQTYWVYFVDPDEGDIHRMRLNGSQSETFMDTDLETGSRLVLWTNGKSITRGERLDLCVMQPGRRRNWILEEEFAPSESGFVDLDIDKDYRPTLGRSAFAADLRHEDESHIYVRIYGKGLEVADDMTSQSGDYYGLSHWIFAYGGLFSLQFKTTIGSWRCVNASILPGDLVIFEFGGQICALDLNQRKLAFIRFGSGPVVVREPDSEAVESQE